MGGFNWDWAAGEARGKMRWFFSLDRWPLQLQSEEIRSRIGSDEDIDRDMILDPLMEDPVPSSRSSKPFEEEKVKRTRDPAVYVLGDTKLRRRKIEKDLRGRIECGKSFPCPRVCILTEAMRLTDE